MRCIQTPVEAPLMSTKSPNSESSHQACDNQIFASAYQQLRKIAGRHLSRNDLNRHLTTTDLVHEAWLKLNGAERNCQSRTHFFALGSRAMRQILVDRARRRSSQKRGGMRKQFALDECHLSAEQDQHVIMLDDVLRRLEQQSSEQALIVKLRFFSGMTISDVADHLGRSTRWVEREWKLIREWLREELSED